ncbi:MAG: PD40 domain-containing protein, partial [Thermomicrobiaceae bacterium]|nr:PD40 domain-containing protein [Thermomicrobiaceae bacterium]
MHDMMTGITERVSVASGGVEARGDVVGISLSADGRYAAFASSASNLIPGDGNGTADVFAHDRVSRETTWISVRADGAPGNGPSVNPAVSADGRAVAFASLASNLVGGDTNRVADVFATPLGFPVALRLAANAGNPVLGSMAILTATLTTAEGQSARPLTVHFQVRGAHASEAVSAVSDAAGGARLSYTGRTLGQDEVVAWVDLDGSGDLSSGDLAAETSLAWRSPSGAGAPAAERSGCRYFRETQHNLCGGFQAYWSRFGGRAGYGLPLTEEYVDPTSHLVTQYFERARFEWHPGAWPARYDVLLGRLGSELTLGRAEPAFLSAALKPDPSCRYFPETRHNLCGGFRAYWERYGGLAVYGLPLTEEFREVNPDDGRVYTVQY